FRQADRAREDLAVPDALRRRPDPARRRIVGARDRRPAGLGADVARIWLGIGAPGRRRAVRARDGRGARGHGGGEKEAPPALIVARRCRRAKCRVPRDQAWLKAMPAVTIETVRRLATSLPRSEEHLIRGRIKFRVGRIVYLAFSRDGMTMGFAFPKEWRAALVEAEPDRFCMPGAADLPSHWLFLRLARLAAPQ